MNTTRVPLAIVLSAVVVGCGAADLPVPSEAPSAVTPAATVGTHPDPVQIVDAWTAARNRGDVDAALALLAERADVFGFEVVSPLHRERLRDLLRAQAIAEWVTDESDCRAAADTVTCRYRTEDVAMRRWGLALTGEHEYRVIDGRITSARRTHDAHARDRVYAMLEAFRAWAREHHPAAERVIWSEPGSAAYSTAEGARAFVTLLAQYEP